MLIIKHHMDNVFQINDVELIDIAIEYTRDQFEEVEHQIEAEEEDQSGDQASDNMVLHDAWVIRVEVPDDGEEGQEHEEAY